VKTMRRSLMSVLLVGVLLSTQTMLAMCGVRCSIRCNGMQAGTTANSTMADMPNFAGHMSATGKRLVLQGRCAQHCDRDDADLFANQTEQSYGKDSASLSVATSMLASAHVELPLHSTLRERCRAEVSPVDPRAKSVLNLRV
jgi:hypothetical protein